MWVACNEKGNLHLFRYKPSRIIIETKKGKRGVWSVTKKDHPEIPPTANKEQVCGFYMIPHSMFPELKWEGEPIEVELIKVR